MKLKDKTIVVTGASSGIGEAAAKQLAEAGAKVCLLARRESKLQRVKDDITRAGGSAWIYPVDLTDQTSLDACSAALLREHDRIDVLVNNAGDSISRPITESLDRFNDFKRLMDINYLGAVGLTLKLLPRMLEQEDGQVINVSSMGTQVPLPYFSAYVASKAALESFSRSLLAELGYRGIDVTVVSFPLVRTPLSLEGMMRHMPMMDVDKAGRWIVKAVRKRPTRVENAVGVLGSVALAALPGPVTRLPQPVFRFIERHLDAQQQKKPQANP